MKLETFLDVFLIEEIAVVDAQSTGISDAQGREIVRTARAGRKSETGKILSRGEKFPMYGVWVDNPYNVGDIVKTNDVGRNYILLNPDDEFKPEATKYYLIRYADIEGRVVS